MSRTIALITLLTFAVACSGNDADTGAASATASESGATTDAKHQTEQVTTKAATVDFSSVPPAADAASSGNYGKLTFVASARQITFANRFAPITVQAPVCAPNAATGLVDCTYRAAPGSLGLIAGAAGRTGVVVSFRATLDGGCEGDQPCVLLTASAPGIEAVLWRFAVDATCSEGDCP